MLAGYCIRYLYPYPCFLVYNKGWRQLWLEMDSTITFHTFLIKTYAPPCRDGKKSRIGRAGTGGTTIGVQDAEGGISKLVGFKSGNEISTPYPPRDPIQYQYPIYLCIVKAKHSAIYIKHSALLHTYRLYHIFYILFTDLSFSV